VDRPKPRQYFDMLAILEWANEHHPDAVWLLEQEQKAAECNGYLGGIDFADTLRDMRKHPDAYKGHDTAAIESLRDALDVGDYVRLHVWW
jgi:hypothetical protein